MFTEEVDRAVVRSVQPNNLSSECNVFDGQIYVARIVV